MLNQFATIWWLSCC